MLSIFGIRMRERANEERRAQEKQKVLNITFFLIFEQTVVIHTPTTIYVTICVMLRCLHGIVYCYDDGVWYSF